MSDEVLYIPVTEVIDFIRQEPRFGGSAGLAAAGKREHKLAFARTIRSGGAALSGMGSVGVPGIRSDYGVVYEKPCQVVLDNDAILTCHIDMIAEGGRVVIETKPDQRAGHALQLMFNCWMWSLCSSDSALNGVLYFYKLRESYVLPGGGNEYWNYCAWMGNMVAEIIRGQGIYDTLVWRDPRRDQKGEQLAGMGKELKDAGKTIGISLWKSLIFLGMVDGEGREVVDPEGRAKLGGFS